MNGEVDPTGERAAASDDLPGWLRPWMVDHLEGATVNEVLGLLLAAALDPAIFEFDELAARGVVHPGELARRNRAHLTVTNVGPVWTLSHHDGRAPLRLLRRGDETLLLGRLDPGARST